MSKINKIFLFTIFLTITQFTSLRSFGEEAFQIGQGISDITGPAAEVVMMGYANSKQVTAGIHTRLYARAFIFKSALTQKRVVYVSTDLVHLYSSIKQGVIKSLNAKYGTLYNDSNVLITATHTHAGPGGFSHHTIYNFTSYGFIRQNYNVIVNGIIAAIEQAHNNMEYSSLSLSSAMLSANANINRSPEAIKLNEEWNTSQPPDLEDKSMNVLRIEGPKGIKGMISWFPVHATSLSRNNRLISSDNKGLASYEMEKWHGSIAPYIRPGEFVAAFSNGAEGDLSPNTLPEYQRPGKDEFEALQISGAQQFDMALQLLNGSQTPMSGDIDYRHIFVKMPGFQVNNHTLCKAAFGFSFAAGAEDGPSGLPIFKEGMTRQQFKKSQLTNYIESFKNLFIPLSLQEEYMDSVQTSKSSCQGAKPVLLPTGILNWTPEILPFQLLRIGSLALLAIPGEMTTQAGRRLTNQVQLLLQPLGVKNVLIVGLSNEYSSYITTPEEYQSQQYEGASTLYGPYTFEAYQKIFNQLAKAMAADQSVDPGPTPKDLSSKQKEYQIGVIYDDTHLNESFGTVLEQPPEKIKTGNVVKASFRSGHPKNNLKTNDTYLLIERLDHNKVWVPVAWDSIPETRFYWKHDFSLFCIACSRSTVEWHIPSDALPGIYRIRHFGDWKNGYTGEIISYQGVTQNFSVE